jgi:hypothetical protein
MTRRNDLPQDEQISQWQSKALKLSPDCNIEEFFYPHYSSYTLRRLALTQKRRYQSLELCAKVAARHEYLAAERCRQEADRIEKLIYDVSKDVSLFESASEDSDSFREFILFYCVNKFVLVDIDDEDLRRIFQNKNLYFHLYENRAEKQDKEFWARMVEKFGGPGA